MIDLDAYAARIEWRGPRRADAETLAALQLAHATHIPFENLDISRGVAIDLAPERVFDKLVTRRRGGYCFEQNGLFLEVLRAIGFSARALSARVASRTSQRRPRTHMALLVDAGPRTYLADVGFGIHNMIAPLPFEPGRDLGAFRIREHGWDGRALGPPPSFEVEARERDAWKPLYHLSLEEQEQPDFVVANWYTSTHPESTFVKHRIVSIAFPDGGRAVMIDDDLETTRADGTSEKRTIAEADRASVLRDTFRLSL